MNAARAAAALVDRGLDPAERAAKQALFERVIARHAAIPGRTAAYLWWVPGRLEVFGKHTDYAGGRTLVSPVPRGFAVAASARAGNVIYVADAVRGEDVTIVVDRDGAHTGWRHYVAALGADITMASDLPSACGMSSSSALVVAIAAALGRVAALAARPAWKTNIRSPLDLAGYYACLENGRSFAALGGDAGVGTHGGSEDHTAMIAGRPRQVSAFAFVPPRALGAAAVPDAWRFVIAPSGVAARKTGEARVPYNRLSAATTLLLEAWNRERPRARSLAAALDGDATAADRFRELAGQIATAHLPAAALRDRLDHFIREDARVMPALAAFANGDAATLGDLSAASQREAEALLGNQVPATSALAASARKLGAFAACSFGAGFGGAVWALAPTADVDAFMARWHPDAFVITPGVPLTELGPAD
jgi:galactokinase